MIIDDDKLISFLKSVYTIYEYDFVHYNRNTVKRRIENHSIKLMIEEFENYAKLILSEKKYFDEMFSYLSINITEFFREPKQLKIFREKVIPYLNSYTHINIWCAGCSSGESPYTLAMILHEEGVLEKSQIYATDFNNRVLTKAKDGLFDIENIELSCTNYNISAGSDEFKDYFVKQGKYFKIKKFLKKHILFFNHNLVTDSAMNKFQLIICKNVVIYFDEQLKEHVINLFDESLECNCFLILGNSEYLPEKFKKHYKLYSPHSKVYHKICK